MNMSFNLRSNNTRKRNLLVSAILISILICGNSGTFIPVKSVLAQENDEEHYLAKLGWEADVSYARDDVFSDGEHHHIESNFKIIFPVGSNSATGTAKIYSTVSGTNYWGKCTGSQTGFDFNYKSEILTFTGTGSKPFFYLGVEHGWPERTFTCTSNSGISKNFHDAVFTPSVSRNFDKLVNGAMMEYTEASDSTATEHYKITFHATHPSLVPSGLFSFKITTPNFWNVTQGSYEITPITVTTLSGEPEYVKLSATDWSKSDIYTDFYPNEVITWKSSNVDLAISTGCNTPPGNYLLTITGSTEGDSTNLPVTSQQAVTVVVSPSADCGSSYQSTPNSPPYTPNQSTSTSPSENTPSPKSSQNIPSWVRNNAKWWADGSITETDFIKGIQYLIQQGLIVVPSSQGVTNTSQAIPSWVKNTAKWWADGSVNDSDFINAIQYLVKNGIISVQQETSSNVPSNSQSANQQLKTFHNYGFSFDYPADWVVVDKTTDKNMPHIQIHSNDSSAQVTMGVASNTKEFSGLTDQAYLNALINYYKSKCNSNPACTNFKLINSQIIPFEGGSLYMISFETQNTSAQGNVIPYTVTDAEIPTPEGTWIMIAEGPSANYALYSKQIGNMISSMNFDQNTAQSSTTTSGASTQSYGGYSNWDEYCQAKYGSSYYDSSKNQCIQSYGGYSNWDEYCQGTYGSNSHYDSSTDTCVTLSSGSSTGGGQSQTQQGTLTPARDLTGQWRGTLSGSATYDYYDQSMKAPVKAVCQFSGPVSFSLTQRGNNLGGNVDSTQVSVTGHSSCPSSQALGGAIQATVSSSSFSGNVAGIPMTGQFTTDLIRGWLNGNIGEISVTGQFTAERVR